MPYCAAIGSSSGTISTVAEKISRIAPRISRNTSSTMQERRRSRHVLADQREQPLRDAGIDHEFVDASDTPRIVRIAPTRTIDSRMIRGTSRHGDLAQDHELDDHHVQRRDCGRFRDGEEAAVDAAQHDDRQRQIPPRRPDRFPSIPTTTLRPRRRQGRDCASSSSSEHDDHQDARQHARDEKIVDRSLGDDSVQNQRQRGREQQAEAARRRDEPQLKRSS